MVMATNRKKGVPRRCHVDAATTHGVSACTVSRKMRRLLRPAARRALCTSSSSARTTHFGYRTVPEDDKERLVGHVFDSVASNYDLMNDVMSGGVHRLWKDTLVGMLHASAKGNANLQVLDVAGGTGDVAFRIANDLARAPPSDASNAATLDEEAARVVVCDINPSMLAEGRRRADALPPVPSRPRLEFVTADACNLPFDDCTFDVYTIAFGLRNVTRQDEALKEAHRVLRPGGRFLCLEFSHVTNPIAAAVYEQYSFNVIPYMGELIAADRASYQYLVESIRKHPKQEKLASMMREAGMRAVSYTNLTFGAVAIHSGFRLPG